MKDAQTFKVVADGGVRVREDATVRSNELAILDFDATFTGTLTPDESFVQLADGKGFVMNEDYLIQRVETKKK